MRFADVQLKPSPTALPGSAVLQQFANGLAAWALIGALIVISGGLPRMRVRVVPWFRDRRLRWRGQAPI